VGQSRRTLLTNTLGRVAGLSLVTGLALRGQGTSGAIGAHFANGNYKLPFGVDAVITPRPETAQVIQELIAKAAVAQPK